LFELTLPVADAQAFCFYGQSTLSISNANMIMLGAMELEKTSSQNHFPVKCLECAKSSKPFIHGRCSFCQGLSFQEEVFCSLNRSTQNPAFFECHAYQPLLKLVASSDQEARLEPKTQSEEITLKKLLNSDKVKYQRSLALQKLARNPDDVLLEIKYHFAWNVVGRRPAFAEYATTIGFISDTVSTCSDAVGGFASLLCLAPDHIHLYVESDGEISPDNMAQKLKCLLEVPILERFPDLIASPEVERKLWDEAYFVETIS
jgi:REP element-mobilizing transposase RayT